MKKFLFPKSHGEVGDNIPGDCLMAMGVYKKNLWKKGGG
jgi:hypothetical protein